MFLFCYFFQFFLIRFLPFYFFTFIFLSFFPINYFLQDSFLIFLFFLVSAMRAPCRVPFTIPGSVMRIDWSFDMIKKGMNEYILEFRI